MPVCGILESPSGILMFLGCSIYLLPLDGAGCLFAQLSPTQGKEVMSKPWLGPSPWNLPSPPSCLPHSDSHMLQRAQREGERSEGGGTQPPARNPSSLENGCAPRLRWTCREPAFLSA